MDYVTQLEKRLEELEISNAILEAHNENLIGNRLAQAGDIITIQFTFKFNEPTDFSASVVDTSGLLKNSLRNSCVLIIDKMLKKHKNVMYIEVRRQRVYKHGLVNVWRLSFAKYKRKWRLNSIDRGYKNEPYALIPIKSQYVGIDFSWCKNPYIQMMRKEIQNMEWEP